MDGCGCVWVHVGVRAGVGRYLWVWVWGREGVSVGAQVCGLVSVGVAG